MQLHPIDSSAIQLVAAWMASKENYQWLDFGEGNQILTPVSLKIMTQRDIHLFRVFTSDFDQAPIGLVALTHIAHNFKTATLWYVLGDKRYAGQGYTTRAVSRILTMGFKELGLHAINAWAVESNEPSIRVLTRNRFQMIGRQRRCHYIGGRPFDRLLFDLCATEHEELDVAGDRNVESRVAELLLEKLHLEVSSVDTDLLKTGTLDSLQFVELLVYLEQEFGISISLDDLEIDRFRSIAAIAQFIVNHR